MSVDASTRVRVCNLDHFAWLCALCDDQIDDSVSFRPLRKFCKHHNSILYNDNSDKTALLLEATNLAALRDNKITSFQKVLAAHKWPLSECVFCQSACFRGVCDYHLTFKWTTLTDELVAAQAKESLVKVVKACVETKPVVHATTKINKPSNTSVQSSTKVHSKKEYPKKDVAKPKHVETDLDKQYRAIDGSIGFNKYVMLREPERWNKDIKQNLGDNVCAKRKREADGEEALSKSAMLASCTDLGVALVERIKLIRETHPNFCERFNPQPRMGLFTWEVWLREFYITVIQHQQGMVDANQKAAWALVPEDMKSILPEYCKKTR